MTFAGRAVVVSELDPVPPMFRCGPRVIVVNRREARALASGDHVVTAQLNAAIDHYDRAMLCRLLGLDKLRGAS